MDAVRSSSRKPGDVFYVEVPFPQTDDDVLTDFKSGIAHCTNGAIDAQVIDSVRRDSYRYEVLRVTNWAVDECSDLGNAFFLVRIYKRTGGEGVTQIVVDEAGDTACYAPKPTALPLIPTIADADRALARAQIHAADGEYVYVSRPWTDDPNAAVHLYVAYRNSDGIYVVGTDGVWFLPKDGKRVSLGTVFNLEKLDKELESFPDGAGPFSVNGTQFAIGLPVNSH